jgi:hypothetical protein
MTASSSAGRSFASATPAHLRVLTVGDRKHKGIVEVDLSVEDEALVIRRAAPPRAGWEEAFVDMMAAGEGGLLDPPVATSWDQREWEW